ncbi:MAG TPA: 16S rRNA (uracil(1498)-N(3))-methyltransferase [Gammaproteobacteria bacterium]|nr:16S rRNA (uracil(1498)-N(3))-methyltransferase [Gammaproteobacteria bacterium]
MPAKRRVPRLFLERELNGHSAALDEREAHYLGHVLRLQRGDELVAFNGRGAERLARVRTLHRRGAELELGAERGALPESPLDLTLVQAIAKADAMDFIVQKSTELGVRTIRPVYTEFSVVKLDDERAERRVEHWRKIARSACEQCGRHSPPLIAPPAGLRAGCEALPAATLKLALDLEAAAPLARVQLDNAPLALAVGPEGGFSAEDWRRLDAAGFARITLGPRVLRAETAALAACGLAQSLWGDG